MQEEYLTANGLSFKTLRTGSGERLALLLHGFPDDAGSMAPLMERLAEEGYTAVAPYMRGYGETDRAPDERYRVSDLARDALGLIEELGGTDALLVGHDWGAGAARLATRIDSERIGTVVTMAVPPNMWARAEEHPIQLYRSWYMAFFRMPRLPERVLRADDFAMIERLWREWSPGWDYPADRLEAVKETFRHDGTVEAALEYYRQSVYTKASGTSDPGPVDVPWLLIGGARDGCIGSELFDVDDGAEVDRVEIVPDAGHFMQMEAPGTVGDLIVAFAGE